MAMRHEADWLGATYVVEGATLSGQVIVKALSADLNLTPGAGLAFFSSYDAEVGRMWRETRDKLAAHADARSGDLIVASALTTFERIRLLLCEGR
jgi:heme oxygenase